MPAMALITVTGIMIRILRAPVFVISLAPQSILAFYSFSLEEPPSGA